MKIGIDGNEANVANRVGIGEFANSLLQEFYQNNSKHDFTIYLKDKPNEEFPHARDNWHYRVFGPKKLWTQIGLPARLFLGKKPDVFFTPSHYAPRFSPVPTVVSVMDLSYMHFPELFNKDDLYQLTHWTEYSVKKASRVITISEASKNDIIKLYHIPDKKVSVVYPGIKTQDTLSPAIYAMHTLAEKYGISKDFILYVGTLQPRKNIEKLIEAFSMLRKDASEKHIALVIVGKKGWQYEDILQAPEKFGIQSSVKFLDFVPDDELSMLYKNAICFVLPSLYEGFGLPVLEAMKHGCPVITSNVSSLPEAGGDAALYVDPNNTKSISDAMEKLIEDKKLRADLIEKGKRQVMKFSWTKAAEETLAILEEVGSHER